MNNDDQFIENIPSDPGINYHRDRQQEVFANRGNQQGNQGNQGYGGQGGYQQQQRPNYQNNGGGGNNYQGGYQNNGGGGGYQKKPFDGNRQWPKKAVVPFGPIELYKPYAIVGNREAPTHVLGSMTRLAKELDSHGFTCRIDGGEGPSAAVEPLECRKELTIPWKGFNEKESNFSYNQPESFEIAKLFHPTYDNMKPAAQAFLARNARVIMGRDLKSPIMFLICWTEDGVESMKDKTSRTGFAGHLIAMASALGVPVYNMQRPDAETRLRNHLGISTTASITDAPTQGNFDHGQSQQDNSNFNPNPGSGRY